MATALPAESYLYVLKNKKDLKIAVAPPDSKF